MIQIVKKASMYQRAKERPSTQTVVPRVLLHIVGTCSMDQVVQPHQSNVVPACLARHLGSGVSLLAHSSTEAKSVSTCIYWSHPEPAVLFQMGRYIVIPVQCSKMSIGCFEFLG